MYFGMKVKHFIFPHIQFCKEFQVPPFSLKRRVRLLDNRRVTFKYEWYYLVCATRYKVKKNEGLLKMLHQKVFETQLLLVT